MKTPRHKTIPSTGLIFRSTSRVMSPASGREMQTWVVVVVVVVHQRDCL